MFFLCFCMSVCERIWDKVVVVRCRLRPKLHLACASLRFRTVQLSDTTTVTAVASLVGQHPVGYKRSRRLLIPSIFRLCLLWKSQSFEKIGGKNRQIEGRSALPALPSQNVNNLSRIFRLLWFWWSFCQIPIQNLLGHPVKTKNCCSPNYRH